MDKNDKDSLTGLKKRQQISKANRVVFAWIVAASLVICICGVFVQFLIRQLTFNNVIYGTLAETSSTLEKNIKAYDGLKSSVVKLIDDTNLSALKKGDNSTALQVIIGALPTEENRAALATSMQNEVLGPAGVTINSFSVGEEDAGTTSSTAIPNIDASSFQFSFSITGTYQQVQQAIKNMERSIRPITIQSVDIQGTSAKLSASITATTYYQPSKGIQLKEVEKKP
jgi:Tfp pilus assembly protein PilO